MAEQLIFIIFIVLIFLGLFLSFTMGANDETLAALVGANAVKFKVALIVGGVAAGLGMIFLSQGVGKTVGADILGPGVKYTTFMLLAVLISSMVWLILGSFAGIPLSSTHSTVGSIFGVLIVYSLMVGGVEPATALNYAKLGNVVLSWFISPLMALIMTYILYRLIAKYYLSRLKGLTEIEKSERKFTWMLLITVIFAELWVGANSAEVIGIFYGMRNSGMISTSQYIFFIVLAGINIFLGIFLVGRFVIKKLAVQMTDSRPHEGFIVQLSSGVILMIATFLGLPISHSHVIVFCIFGINFAQKKEIDFKALGKMAVFWVLTFPVAAIIAGFIYFGFFSYGML